MDADFFCLQETKMQEGQLDLEFEGYRSYWNYAEKKGYSGTAIFSRHAPLNVTYGLGLEEHDKEGRVITLEMPDFFLVTVYTPNSQDGLSDWLTTIGGVYGRVVAITDRTVVIETSEDRVRVEFLKSAIGQVGTLDEQAAAQQRPVKKAKKEEAAEETPAVEEKTSDEVTEAPAEADKTDAE